VAAKRVDLSAAWAGHAEDWRHPAQAITQWHGAGDLDPALLRYRATKKWWDVLEAAQITLLVTREYEHLVVALAVVDGAPRVSSLPLAHPSGIAADQLTGRVHIASTRNPNQVFELAPVEDVLPRADSWARPVTGPVLTPMSSRMYPGALYIHDLAVVDGRLLANAVGQNAVVHLDRQGGLEPVWWPKAIDSPVGPRFDANVLQLNSIAAGDDLESSYFTASAASPGRYRPGHPRFPVDGCGVLFSGKTRDVVASGLTRPHSARLHGGDVWVCNSGYGELGRVRDGAFEPVWRLRGWTRGLAFAGDHVFVATSRVIPRFKQYAPGLDVNASLCAIHAIDLARGEIVAHLTWPSGNQIFAIDWLPVSLAHGLPFRGRTRHPSKAETNFFYTFRPQGTSGQLQKDRNGKRI